MCEVQVDRESGRRKELGVFKLPRSIALSAKVERNIFLFIMKFHVARVMVRKNPNNYVNVLFRRKRRKRLLFQRWSGRLPFKPILV